MNVSRLLGATMVAGAGLAPDAPREAPDWAAGASRRRTKTGRSGHGRHDPRPVLQAGRSDAKVAR